MSAPRQGPSGSTRNWRPRRHRRASFVAVFTRVGIARRHGDAVPPERFGCEPRARASSGSIAPSGVSIHASPSTRRTALAHPAVLSHAATGPCCPAVGLENTSTAPDRVMTALFLVGCTRRSDGIASVRSDLAWHRRAALARSGPVRILQVVGQSHRRGAEMFALELASGLDAMGHDNRMVALGLAFDGGRDPDLPAL